LISKKLVVAHFCKDPPNDCWKLGGGEGDDDFRMIINVYEELVDFQMLNGPIAGAAVFQ